jgi:hypothetical protein
MKRQLVFCFAVEVYRETRTPGVVWLTAEPEDDRHDGPETGGEEGGEHPGGL